MQHYSWNSFFWGLCIIKIISGNPGTGTCLSKHKFTKMPISWPTSHPPPIHPTCKSQIHKWNCGQFQTFTACGKYKRKKWKDETKENAWENCLNFGTALFLIFSLCVQHFVTGIYLCACIFLGGWGFFVIIKWMCAYEIIKVIWTSRTWTISAKSRRYTPSVSFFPF